MEATAKLNVAFAGTTVVALGDISAGASKAEDEAEEKLSFFFRNSSQSRSVVFSILYLGISKNKCK